LETKGLVIIISVPDFIKIREVKGRSRYLVARYRCSTHLWRRIPGNAYLKKI